MWGPGRAPGDPEAGRLAFKGRPAEDGQGSSGGAGAPALAPAEFCMRFLWAPLALRMHGSGNSRAVTGQQAEVVRSPGEGPV